MTHGNRKSMLLIHKGENAIIPYTRNCNKSPLSCNKLNIILSVMFKQKTRIPKEQDGRRGGGGISEGDQEGKETVPTTDILV